MTLKYDIHSKKSNKVGAIYLFAIQTAAFTLSNTKRGTDLGTLVVPFMQTFHLLHLLLRRLRLDSTIITSFCMEHVNVAFQNFPPFSLPLFQDLGYPLPPRKALQSNQLPTFTCCMQNFPLLGFEPLTTAVQPYEPDDIPMCH